ncbi:MAG: carboxypeptidase-like regulatory domain-containing protein [Chitinophagales bacterium]|nr:carboxypeptidase-like regulatory domain-containing protein [Chitinophagales bacterium]
MMSTKSYTIQIPTSCQEKWYEMLPVEQGRFCLSCQKKVIDFTQLTDGEIIQMMEQKDHLCGRFRTSQLNRPIELISGNNRRIQPYRLAAAMLLLPIANEIQANEVREREIVQPTETASEDKQVVSDTTHTKHYIKGILLDSTTKEPLIGASIILVGTSISTVADEDGRFYLEIPEAYWKNNQQVDFSYLGYETATLIISEDYDFVNQKIYLTEEDLIIFGVMVREPKNR